MQFIMIEQIVDDDDADLEGLRAVVSEAARNHGFKLHTVMKRQGLENMFDGIDKIMDRSTTDPSVNAKENLVPNLIFAFILLSQLLFFIYMFR